MIPTPSIDLQSLILFFGSCQALLFILLLVFKKQRKRAINLHIAILLFAIGSETAHQFLLQSNYIYQMPFLVGFALPFDSLVGISLYWYVRLITHPELNNSFSRVIRHYAIFFLCFALSIPYWLLGFDEKLYLMQTGVVPSSWPWLAYVCTWAQSPIKIITFLTYLALSIRMLLIHRQRIKNVFSNRHAITLNWLTYMLALFILGAVKGVGGLIFFQQYADETQVMGYMGFFSMLAIFYIGIMGLMQPVIYSKREQYYLETARQNRQQADSPLPSSDATSSTSVKYQNSSLGEADMKRIAEKLNAKMTEERLFLDASLTMPRLAQSIGVSPNYLSQTINTWLETSFFDYINGLRVKYAQILLTDPQTQSMGIIDIAMESAFNSRSTFYAAFKQITGITPAQYRKSAPQKLS